MMKGDSMADSTEGGGKTPTTPPAWLRNKPGAIQPKKPKDAYYRAPVNAPFGNQQGGSLPAWAIPANATVYGPALPSSSPLNGAGGPLPTWATPSNAPSSTTPYVPATTPAPFYTNAQLPRQTLPKWMQVKGEQFAQHNDPAAYAAAAAATQQPQYPYLNDPATPPTAAPFMTLADFLNPTYGNLPMGQPAAPTGTGFGSQYNWKNRSYGKGGYGRGYSDYGGYDSTPAWANNNMGLYSWNFKG